MYTNRHTYIYTLLSQTSLLLLSNYIQILPFFFSGKNVFQRQHQASADSTIKYRFLYSLLSNQLTQLCYTPALSNQAKVKHSTWDKSHFLDKDSFINT